MLCLLIVSAQKWSTLRSYCRESQKAQRGEGTWPRPHRESELKPDLIRPSSSTPSPSVLSVVIYKALGDRRRSLRIEGLLCARCRTRNLHQASGLIFRTTWRGQGDSYFKDEEIESPEAKCGGGGVGGG